MQNKDIRWRQRFVNFEKAFLKLKEAAEAEQLNELERNGLVQRFEFTLDLSWKVMKDFLEEKGFNFKPSPKDTMRLAQQSNFIDYAQQLIDGLEIRNELSHDYNGEKFEKSEKELREEIYPALEKLYKFFLDQSQSSQMNLSMTNNNRNKFGLTERDMKTIQEILIKYPEVREVRLFGSRAKGNYKPGSDIDMAVINEGVSSKTINDLSSDFEESSLPYTVDVVNFPTLSHKEFMEHITNAGIEFYKHTSKV